MAQSSSNENQDLITLQALEEVIFSLKNIETAIQLTMNLFNDKFPYSFNLIICQLIYSSFASQKSDYKIYFDFIKGIEAKEEEIKPTITEVFMQFLLLLETQESNFLLEKMINQKLIETSSIKERYSLYFAHYMLEDEIASLISNAPFRYQFYLNMKELQKDDWTLHKKYVYDGLNPLNIIEVIRNDDVKNLQDLSSQSNFDYNQKIDPSLYEKCSYINQENVTIISYAAFFGAINCFKFLLMNGANALNTGKYAVAGGNLEIIHLCEQNHSSFEEAYEAAIEFHRNKIFRYLYDNKTVKIEDYNELGKHVLNIIIMKFFRF